jgi:hypothetical protein
MIEFLFYSTLWGGITEIYKNEGPLGMNRNGTARK